MCVCVCVDIFVEKRHYLCDVISYVGVHIKVNVCVSMCLCGYGCVCVCVSMYVNV